MQEPIINLFRSFEEAMYFRNSQINTKFIFSGVHLIPEYGLISQVTNTPEGVLLRDFSVEISNLRGTKIQDITTSFKLVKEYSVNGLNQVLWSLENVSFDMGWDLCYMIITNYNGKKYYSNVFRCTNIDSEKTTSIIYKRNKEDDFQYLPITAWYRESDVLHELTNYYEVSTMSTVNAMVTQNLIEYWRTEIINRDILIDLKKIFTLPYFYLNTYRSYLFESPEIPQSASQENFSYMSFTISKNLTDRIQQGDFKRSDFYKKDFLIYKK